MNNKFSKPSPAGKTLYAKGLEDNLDGTFEALITTSTGKYVYTCRLYNKIKDNMTKIPFNIVNEPLTLECVDYDDNDVLLVKIVG